jgi:putative transposase
VERNGLRAGLVARAQDWRWSSLWRRLHPHVVEGVPPLAQWPLTRPADSVRRVNRPETDAELAAVLTTVQRGRPFGDDAWQRRTAGRLGLMYTFRPRGRPRKSRATSVEGKK